MKHYYISSSELIGNYFSSFNPLSKICANPVDPYTTMNSSLIYVICEI